jgi:hypothetical protein
MKSWSRETGASSDQYCLRFLNEFGDIAGCGLSHNQSSQDEELVYKGRPDSVLYMDLVCLG